jgi:CBS domain-containing protein
MEEGYIDTIVDGLVIASMLVKEIMVTDLVRIEQDKSVFDACELYRTFKVGSIVVTQQDSCVGIVTERNLIERCICLRRDPDTTKVAEIMTANPITIHRLETVEKAIDLMKAHKIKKLPVVADDKIVGIITMTDIAYARPDLSDRFVDSWIKPRWIS